MMWLLDTNAWIGYLNSRPSPLKERIKRKPIEMIWLCDIVKAELYYGAFKSQRQSANLALLRELFNRFDSLSFDGEAASCYGRIRAELAKKGTPIGPYDLQIAAIALAHGLTLVTHNTDEFRRIDGLTLEDWEA
jgi:tRNA(fMet)-specific endonuclease VapC